MASTDNPVEASCRHTLEERILKRREAGSMQVGQALAVLHPRAIIPVIHPEAPPARRASVCLACVCPPPAPRGRPRPHAAPRWRVARLVILGGRRVRHARGDTPGRRRTPAPPAAFAVLVGGRRLLIKD